MLCWISLSLTALDTLLARLEENTFGIAMAFLQLRSSVSDG